MPQQENNIYKRRVRYSGTHPKNFSEKYKEHQPEKYQDTITKVISKGNTPAGMHISICVEEILQILNIQNGEIGLDATLGYGGHTQAMLQKLQGQGHLYALDADPIEIAKTKQRLVQLGYGEDIFTAINTNFSNLDIISMEHGPFDFILADLGLSSMQIDNPQRGFSYKFDGPLDLRLNPHKGIPASERINHLSQEELCGILLENADEPYAQEISRAIIDAIHNGANITTTTMLSEIISGALNELRISDKKEVIKKSCQRTFQAIRIDVNQEFDVLYEFLEKLPSALNSGGRVAILTFHSGEDRLVKKAFKLFFQQGLFSSISTNIIRPSAQECATNSRARSAKLRWAIKA